MTKYEQALSAIENNEISKGKIILQNILISDLNFIPALNDLAVIYFNEGEYEQAIQLFQKIEKINPEVDYFKENFSAVLNELNLNTSI